MSNIAVRRFGTDVSNIPKEVLMKTPKKSHSNENGTATYKPKTPISKKSEPVTPIKSLNNEVLDDEIIFSPQKQQFNNFRYERDFLLSFQLKCNEKLEGLIPEVLPGFVPPQTENIDPIPQKLKSPFANSKRETVTPHGGVVFFKANTPNCKTPNNLDSDCSFSSLASTPIPFKDLNVEIPPVSSLEVAVKNLEFNDRPTSAPNSAPTTPVNPTTINFEWRKKIKKQKPRETDPKRLAARQKQIDIGMNTPGYKRFCELVPIEQRKKEHPKIPDINQVCSKRSWDGQVRKWRRQLHNFDPEGGAGSNENFGDEHEDTNAADEVVSDEEDSSEGEEIEVAELVIA